MIVTGSARNCVLSLMAGHLGQPPDALAGPLICDGLGVFTLLAGKHALVLDTTDDDEALMVRRGSGNVERWFFGALIQDVELP